MRRVAGRNERCANWRVPRSYELRPMEQSIVGLIVTIQRERRRLEKLFLLSMERKHGSHCGANFGKRARLSIASAFFNREFQVDRWSRGSMISRSMARAKI